MNQAIGQLSSGKFYAFLNGYDAEPTYRDSAEALEALLNGESEPAKPQSKPVARQAKAYNVLMTFQYPAWDEVDGIEYRDVMASSKAEANAQARRMADRDGHLAGGKGRVIFVATEAQEGRP